MRKNGIYKNCPKCNKEFYVRNYRKDIAVHCSISCSKKNCVPWNKGLKGFHAGEKHPNWKGGHSQAYRERRNGQYKNWRTSVFERDNYICQDCGVRGCYITAHHIKSFAHYPMLRYEIDNGKTLCEPCHMKTDNYKGRGNLMGSLLT